MCDLAGVGLVALPVSGTQRQVAAGHVLVVGLPLGLAGLDATGEGMAVGRLRHPHGAGVEVSQQTHQGGFALCRELIGGWREEVDGGGDLGLACEGRETGMGRQMWKEEGLYSADTAVPMGFWSWLESQCSSYHHQRS